MKYSHKKTLKCYNKSSMIIKYARIFRYIIAGSIATIANLEFLFVGVHYLKVWYLTAAVISFCLAVIISYLLQKFFVFKNYSKIEIQKQFSMFLIFAIIMLGINTLLMYVFVRIIGIWYMLAQVIVAILIAFMKYNFNKIIFQVNFSKFMTLKHQDVK